MNFANLKTAREYLLANGYVWSGVGAITGAECWKKNGYALFIRRASRGVVVR